jgi:hypothetical protein
MDLMENGEKNKLPLLTNSSFTHTSFARATKGGVRLLNFAYINLDSNRQIGAGSFSKGIDMLCESLSPFAVIGSLCFV